MVYELKGSTADELFAEACWTFKHTAVMEATRNGVVLTQQSPSLITLTDPTQRVLLNPARDANPFFHMMEFIWMMAGRNDAEWIEQFSSNIGDYADNGRFNAAYGYRWRINQGFDQIEKVVEELIHDPSSRQVVMQMWDPTQDRKQAKDKACNTQILFRVTDGQLDMTVINRSNDLVWGALGANIVHMTMLHELISNCSNIPLGYYRVFSTNLHLYEKHWDLVSKDRAPRADVFKWAGLPCLPLCYPRSSITDWLEDAEHFCNGDLNFKNNWFYDVALPMWGAYLDKPNRDNYIGDIKCLAWKKAAADWAARRTAAK